MMTHFSDRSRAFRLAIASILVVSLLPVAPVGVYATPSPAQSAKGASKAGDSKPPVSLLGVVDWGGAPRALVSVEGCPGEVLVTVGDLVAGYTVRSVASDRAVLAREGRDAVVTMQGQKYLRADLSKKTYTLAYAGENDFYPKRAQEIQRAIAQPSRSNKTAPPKRAVAAADGRPAFFRPMLGGWVSSGFGRRIRPRSRKGTGSSFHSGVDIAAPHGSTVYSTAAGRVTKVGSDYSRGRYVEISHGNGWSSVYYHLSKRYVSTGQYIRARQAIGAEGNTGISTGPHLHFEIRKNGQAVDPSRYIPSLRGR